MMLRRSFALVVAFGLLSGSVFASTVVDLDFVVVSNGVPVFGDNFDNGNLDSPPWFTVSGAPGPESGTVLQMAAGDSIAAVLGTLDPQQNMQVQAGFDLTSFPAGSSATLTLFGDTPDDILSFSLLPGGSFLADGNLGVIGFNAVTTSGSSTLDLMVAPDGTTTAVANGVTIFEGETSFGPLTAVSFTVVPEPSSIVLLGLGLTTLIRRRRNRKTA